MPDNALLDVEMNGEWLERKQQVEKYLKEKNSALSTSSFVNIFSWKDFFKFDFELIDGNLCIFAGDELTNFLYLPPLGREISSKAVETCLDKLDELNTNRKISRIENVSADQLRYFPRDRFKFYKKGYEYLYFKNDLIGLKGNAYKSKRASYNRFLGGNSYQFCRYTDDMFEEYLNLYDRWSQERKKKNKDEIYRQMIEENKKAHSQAIKHCSQLGMVGKVVVIKDAIKGYTFGYPINEKVFCVCFEVADCSFAGLPVFIFREFCKSNELNEYDFINVMDDVGLSNMTKVKLSFRPAVMVPSYTVERKTV